MTDEERRANREWNEKFSRALECCKSRGRTSCRGCEYYCKGFCQKGLEPNASLIELLLDPNKKRID